MAFDGTLKFDTAIDKAGFNAGLSGLGDIAKSGLSGIGKIAKAGMAAVTGAVTVRPVSYNHKITDAEHTAGTNKRAS